jgi:uncharacterized protein (DUF433 family)
VDGGGAGRALINGSRFTRLALPFSVRNEGITIDPAVCNGRTCVKGTQIPMQTVLEFLGAGDSVEDVLEEFPSLSREDVLACVKFSSALMGNHFTVLNVARGGFSSTKIFRSGSRSLHR